MTTPRSDRCLGIRTDRFAYAEVFPLDLEIEDAIQISPKMDHPFCFNKCKSNRGFVGEARSQAWRGRAIFVNAHRTLRQMAGEPDSYGADATAALLSTTMDAGMMELHIHWAEGRKNTTIYHITHFNSVALRTHWQLPSLRSAHNNMK